MSDEPLDTVAFAERLLAILDEGRRVSTYKLAVLLGLIELCFEKTKKDGEPPNMVTTPELAEKVIEIYWRQAIPYLHAPGEPYLEQNQGPAAKRGTTLSAKIVREIAEFRRPNLNATLHEARSGSRTYSLATDKGPFDRLRRSVEETLILMPLPKLQRLGESEDRFIYEIAWNDEVRQGTWSGTRDFDNRIHFAAGAARNLVRLSSLLRPLIQQKWIAMVASLNSLPGAELGEFLFGADRASLARVAGPLLELQLGACFYCGSTVRGNAHVDHFIPWSRHADDGIDNLVAADERCNLAKRNFLAGSKHLERWVERTNTRAEPLARIASTRNWPRDEARTLGIVRASYETVPGRYLWVGPNLFEHLDREAVRRVLAPG
jgi:hypothetical protein